MSALAAERRAPALAPSHWLADAEDEHPPDGGALPHRTGVAVVGGGVLGVATAYWLARAGTEVTLLEARRLAWGASGRNVGVMLAGEAPLESPQLLRKVLHDEGIDAAYTETGHLALASGPTTAARMRAEVASRPPGARPLHLLDHDQCEELLGMRINSRFRVGRWLPGAATVNPVALVHGLAHAAVGRGAQIFTDAPARALEPAGSAEVEVVTDRGCVRARDVVVACSALSATLLPGCERLITPIHAQVLSTSPLSPLFSIGLAMDWGAAYWRQAPDGAIVLGGLREHDPQTEVGAQASVDRRVQDALTCFLPEAFPDLPPIGVARRWAGVMDCTPDGRPLVGRWQADGHVWIAAGLGGHGLPPALGIARDLAETIVSRVTGPAVAAFDPRRFTRKGSHA